MEQEQQMPPVEKSRARQPDNEVDEVDVILDRILANIEGRSEEFDAELNLIRGAADRESNETKEAIATDTETVIAILGEQDPAVRDLQLLEQQGRENSDEFLAALEDLPDEFEDITELPDDEIEILGDADDPALAHIEEGTYAPDGDPVVHTESGDYAEVPTPEKIRSQELSPTQRLDAFFRELIPNAITGYDARDIQSGKAPDCYINMESSTATALQSILASAPTYETRRR